MTNAKTLMMAGRALLQVDRPYLTTAIYNMQMVESKDCASLAVDKYWRIYYNPDFLKGWKVHEVATLWYHEVLHLLNDHAARAEAYARQQCILHKMTELSHHIWNIAADCEINDGLVREGRPVKGGWKKEGCTPAKFDLPDDKLAEFYCRKLYERRPPEEDNDSEEESEQRQAPSGTEAEEPNAAEAPPAPEGSADGGEDSSKETKDPPSRGPLGPSSDHHEDVGHANEGSGVTGKEEAFEEGPPPAEGDRTRKKQQKKNENFSPDSQSRQDEVGKDALPGVDPSRADLLRQKTADEILHHSRTHGSVPGSLERLAETIKRPRVDYRKEIAAQVRQGIAAKRGAVDYSYSRPSRR